MQITGWGVTGQAGRSVEKNLQVDVGVAKPANVFYWVP